MEDRAIIELYWARDERAIGESDKKYGDYLRALAGRLVESRDAEECVSDTYLRTWNAIPPERPSVLRAFLARITRNMALDRLRRSKAAKRGGGEAEAVMDELNAVAPEDAFASVSAAELGEYVSRFIRSLPKRDGDIMIRRCFFAESVEAIARRYGMRPNTVSVNLSRSRKRLAEYLKMEGLL